MIFLPRPDNDGFTLLEVLIVMAIIVMLASIAIPNYVVNREQARAAACLANRRTIENDEAAYYALNNSPSLSISTTYRCPGGGVYLWLVSDPADADYPKVACSIHYAGSSETMESPPEVSPPEVTPDPPPDDPGVTPTGALDKLIETIKALGLGKKGRDGEDKLIKNLEDAITAINKGENSKADKKLDSFKKEVDKNKKIDAEDKSNLLNMADEIKEMLN